MAKITVAVANLRHRIGEKPHGGAGILGIDQVLADRNDLSRISLSLSAGLT
jgi:hypothetical protein